MRDCIANISLSHPYLFSAFRIYSHYHDFFYQAPYSGYFSIDLLYPHPSKKQTYQIHVYYPPIPKDKYMLFKQTFFYQQPL